MIRNVLQTYFRCRLISTRLSKKSGATSLEFDYDFSEMFPSFHVAERISQFFKRKTPIDDRLDPVFVEER